MWHEECATGVASAFARANTICLFEDGPVLALRKTKATTDQSLFVVCPYAAFQERSIKGSAA